MTTPPAITIPKLDGETPRAYAARVEYLTMGAGRSLDRVAERAQTAPKPRPTIRLATLKGWSAAYNWQEHAARYDQSLASVAARAHAEEYQRSIEAQRAEAQKVGAELIGMGRAIAAEIARRRDVLEYKPADLAVAVKAILAGFDLRAHALDLDKLLPALLGEEGRDA